MEPRLSLREMCTEHPWAMSHYNARVMGVGMKALLGGVIFRIIASASLTVSVGIMMVAGALAGYDLIRTVLPAWGASAAIAGIFLLAAALIVVWMEFGHRSFPPAKGVRLGEGPQSLARLLMEAAYLGVDEWISRTRGKRKR